MDEVTAAECRSPQIWRGAHSAQAGSGYDRCRPRTKEPAIPPVDEEPDPTEHLDSEGQGERAGEQLDAEGRDDTPAVDDTRSVGGVEPAEGAEDEADDAAMDAKWGIVASEPLVGFGAPPVVAVVVTADPGDWFDETIGSLADQDYENLSVLVIDNGGTEDPTARIAEILPTAFVKRLDADRGFSAAANEALVAVEGAAFYLFLHDDVRLGPDVVTSLVAEAFRSNGGMVGPKLVDWDDPTRLRSVGYSVDPYGFSSSISEPHELDQSQHDTAREVFAVSDACMLVRADLFATIEGFNESIPYFGEDIDLCWRAHTAAATVRLCPSAVVAHRECFEQRRDAENRGRLELRHEARTMLSNYELLRLLRVIPVVVFLSLVDLVGSALTGRFHRVGDIVASWLWNLANVPSLVRARSRVKRSRGTHDSSYMPLMRQGSSRLRTLLRADEGENRLQAAAEAGRGHLAELATGSARWGAGLAVVATILIVVGARDLFTGPIPVMREFVDAGESASALVAEWWSAWREPGLGESAVSPGVVPGLGVVGTLLFGSLGLARRLLVLAPLFVGALGAWKLFSRHGALRGRAALLAAYGLNPVVLNAVAEGRLQALYVYGAAPWILRRVAIGAGVEPADDPTAAHPPKLRQAAGVALGLVLVAAVTPLGAAIVVVSVLIVSVVMAVAGDRGAGGRMAGIVAAGALMSIPVALPWLMAAVLHGDTASLTGLWVGRGELPSGSEMITGSVGPVTVGLFGWGLVVAAGYALAAGKDWRLRWALAGWALSLLSWGSTIALADADLLAGAGPELFLMPAVLGLAVSVAMGAMAFESDVIGADFGLAQVLSAVAVAGLLVALVPVGVAASDGRWYLPEGGYQRVMDLLDGDGSGRVLWVGDPDVLPLSGWELDSVQGLAVGTSVGVDPLVTQRYRLDGGPGITEMRRAVEAALSGQTTRLGRLLAPMGVTHVVVVDRPAPQPFAPLEVPVPAGAVSALREQLDMSEVEINPGLVLFRVAEPWPLRADITDLAIPDGDVGLAEVLAGGWPAPPAVLGEGTGTRFSGSLDGDRLVAQSESANPGWSMSVDGEPAPRRDLLGWQQQFDTGTGGEVVLAWSTPLESRLLQAVQVGALLVLVVLAGRRRRLVAGGPRRRRSGADQAPLLVVSEAQHATSVASGTQVGDPR